MSLASAKAVVRDSVLVVLLLHRVLWTFVRGRDKGVGLLVLLAALLVVILGHDDLVGVGVDLGLEKKGRGKVSKQNHGRQGWGQVR